MMKKKAVDEMKKGRNLVLFSESDSYILGKMKLVGLVVHYTLW